MQTQTIKHTIDAIILHKRLCMRNVIKKNKFPKVGSNE